MRQLLILIAVVALAYADDLSQNRVCYVFSKASDGILKTAILVADEIDEELSNLQDELLRMGSVQQTISRLRGERDALIAFLKRSAEKANSDQSECLEKAKKQGGLFPNTRCIVSSTAKFVINAWGAIIIVGSKVTDIYVNFRKENLSPALRLIRNMLRDITPRVTSDVRSWFQCRLSSLRVN